MGAITEFLETFDVSKLLPKLGDLLSDLRFWVSAFTLAGPIVMLILGLWYFFLPTREANHHIGFRTFFGMGSPKAWKYTQRLAGLSFMIAGLVMTIVSVILNAKYRLMEPIDHATAVLKLIWVQIWVAFVIWVGVQIFTIFFFNRKGQKRRIWQRKPKQPQAAPQTEPEITEEPHN